MRLNGWQRLWVVLTAFWLLLVGVVVWVEWPPHPVLVVKIELEPHAQPVDYYEALAGEFGGKASPAPPDFIPDVPTGLIVNVPGFGNVQFPSNMDQAEVEKARQTLLTARTDNIKTTNNKVLQEFNAKRGRVAKNGLVFGLLPPLALYVIGSSMGWVYRGFKRT